MKFLSIACIAATMALISCKDGGKEVASTPFCSDTTCLTEPLKFESETAGKPFVRINFKDCQIDSIHWEKGGMGLIKDIIFNEFIPNTVKPSKQFISCDIVEGKYAWLKFNDCATGRGFLIKLPFEKAGGSTDKYTSAINNFDPKFKIENGLVAYYDNTFIYVVDINTGQTAKQLLTDQGVTDIDYNNIHGLIDSVNITKANIYAKLNVDKKEVIHNNPLTFK